MRGLILAGGLFALGLARPLSVRSDGTETGPLRFQIRFGPEQSGEPLDGRLLLLVSNDEASEPRFQISEGPRTQLVFGIDVERMKPGTPATIDGAVLGYPLDSIQDLPAGTYNVQALLHRYETFHRADGHTVKLPMDRGEGQQWSRAPGNLYSTPRKVRIDAGRGDVVEISLDKVIPPIPDPPATRYVKHERIQSERLTKFWSRPFFLGAHVLLPEGYDGHPQARYPLVIFHGHFPPDLGGFRETPPDPNLKCEYSERFRLECYNRIQQEQHVDDSWKRTPRPGMRNSLGHVTATLEEANRLELVLGTRSRSGQQWDIWEAVYSPAGPDGYPKRIWDKRTGLIDHDVAAHWRENYDLSYILRRDWSKGLGKKLQGKLHIYVGEADNYYLNDAVYLVEEFLKGTKDPHYDGEVDYEPRAEHCWNGDHTRPNAISRLRYHQMFAPKIVERILSTAPAGGDVTSWRY